MVESMRPFAEAGDHHCRAVRIRAAGVEPGPWESEKSPGPVDWDTESVVAKVEVQRGR